MTKYKILLILLLINFSATAIVITSAYFAISLFLSRLSLIFPGGSDFNRLEEFQFFSYLAVIIISIFLPAVCVYLLQKPIAEFAQNQLISILLSIFGSILHIFLIVAFIITLAAFYQPPEKANEKLEREKRKKGEKINVAASRNKIDVICKNARLVSKNSAGNKVNYVAEFVLQINNIPKEIEEFEFQVNQIGDGATYQPGSFDLRIKQGNSRGVRPLNIKAASKSGEWQFYRESDKLLIGNDREFSFKLEFCQENQQNDLLPKTITPELKIRPNPSKDYFKQQSLFNQPIPVNFDSVF